ncbi:MULTISPECIES: phenylacetate--CoA ligase family protein [unclassified Chitinophaga]|uniref:phenylacetate--CoA ligase family protein n=1 Tax=unclassified Chitinophaga TaxID=2619133 RepID=UPI0009C8940D|nr:MULTISPECIES: AMP-binding protein [unclassified Chitinophaga]OMP80433.1 phenylacetate--CoA ligase [[Flexibacter] sp. ATCC 35208]WPV69810.1 AMP-binding protein [Chitinophaga sp. LS1]
MYIPNIELQPATSIRAFQEKEVLHLLGYLREFSPFYRSWFAEHGIQPSDVKSLDDLWRIPPVTKEHLQEQNWDFLCVDKSKIAEYTTTSGTLGRPVIIALTQKDQDRLAYNEYISFCCADGTENDIFQLMLTLDRQFMAGMAYYNGIRKLGAGVLRVGPGVPSLQWENIQRIQPTTIVAVPSFIVKLIAFAKEHNIDINSSSVKKAVCIGENIRNADFTYNVLGKRITEQWDIKLYSTYASTEMQTAFTECNAGHGGHHHPELLYVELLDDNNQPVGPGQDGEVTITTLGVEGMPLLRYKTGDICRYFEEPCSCGRQTKRLSPVIGRRKQMIKYKGTTLYPPALFDLLNDMEEVREFVVEVFSNEIGTDEILLHLWPIQESEDIDRKIRSYLQAKLRVIPQIRYVGQTEIMKMLMPEGLRKPVKFVDNRG